jgi:F-type H+-transporting ATPase subunit b
MHFAWWTLALQTVNFAVLVWLLHRFLYRPVLRMIDERRAEIDKQSADARAAEAKATDRLAAIAAERASIAGEREAALKAAAVQADESAKARLVQAEHEAAALLEGARKTLAAERGQALTEAQRAALDLGAEFAHRLLSEVPMQLRAEAWIERIERHLATLPKSDLGALVRQCANGAALTIVTASPLPSATEETWRTRLRGPLGENIVVRFAVDPALVAGAELQFPDAILHFSWQSALAALRSEAGDRGNAR